MRRSSSPTSSSCLMPWGRASSSSREKVLNLSRATAAKALVPVYETIERVVAELPKAVPLIGFCGAPWTVATYMVEGGGSKDQAAARVVAHRHEAGFQHLIDLLVDISAEYLVNQVKA